MKTFKIDLATLMTDNWTDNLLEWLWERATILLIKLDADLPMPWDATLTVVDGGDFVLDGGAGPCGYGSATVRLPRKDAHRSLEVYVQPHDGANVRFVAAMLGQSRVGYRED